MWEKNRSVRIACALVLTLLVVYAPPAHAVYNLTLGPDDTVNDTATKQTSQFADDGFGGCNLGSSGTSCANISSSEVQVGQSPDPVNPACLEQDYFKAHFHYNTTRLPLSSVILGINWTFNVVTASAEIGANYRITQLGRQISTFTCSNLHTGSTIQFNATTPPSIATTGNKSIPFNPTAIAMMTANKTTNFFAFTLTYFSNPQSMASIGTKEGSNPAWLSVNYTMKPNTTAVSPGAGNTTLGTTQYFNCTAQDDDGLTNVSLYGNWSGTWGLNQTNSTPRNASDHLFTVNGLNPGAYQWGCRSWDNWGADNSSANLSFTMNSSCGNLTANYTLRNDVYANASCFTLGANNVSLDCNGFNIIGNKSGLGVYAENFQNFTLKNCTISNFSTLLSFHNMHNVTISNSSFLSNMSDNVARNLIQISSSNNFQFLSNTVLANTTPTSTPIQSLMTFNGTSAASYVFNSSFNFTGYGNQMFSAYGLFVNGAQNSNVNISFSNISMTSPEANMIGVASNANTGLNLTGNRINVYAEPLSLNAQSTAVTITYSNASIVSNALACWWGDSTAGIIAASSGRNNTFIDNNITAFEGASTATGISIGGNRFSSFANTRINASVYGVEGSVWYDVLMSNTTFVGNPSNEYRLTQNSGNITLLNTSFVKASPFSLATNRNNYTLQWYVRINVTTTSGVPVSGAGVNITNVSSNSPQYQLSTDATGLTGFAIVTSFTGNATVNTSFNPYSFNASYAGMANNGTQASIGNYTPSTIQIILSSGNRAPNVSLNAPANNNITKFRTVNFSFIPDDDLGGFFNCSLFSNESAPWSLTQTNQTPIVNGSINFINYTFSTDGAYKWNIHCSDNGTTPLTNYSIANRTVFVDAAYPTDLTYNSSSTHSGNRSQNFFFVNLSFTEAHLNNCILEINGATNISMTAVAAGSFCYANRTSQSDGGYAYKVYVNDTAGNLNTSAAQTVTLDTTYPQVGWNDPTPANGTTWPNATVVFNISILESNLNATRLDVNGTNYSLDCSSGTCSQTLSLTNGTYWYYSFVNDSAGNSNSTASRMLIVADTTPAGTTNTPPSGGGIGSSSTPPQIIASASRIGDEVICDFRVIQGTYTLLRVETGYTPPHRPQTIVVPVQTGSSTYRFSVAAISSGDWKCRGVVYDISGRTGYGESTIQIGSAQGTPSPSPAVSPTPQPTATPVPTIRPTPTPAPSTQENLISQVYRSISTAQALLLQTRASGIDTQNAENKLISARALASQEEYLKALALVHEAEKDLSNKIAQLKNEGKPQPYAGSNLLQSWILAAGVGLTILAAAWWAFLRKPDPSPSDRRKK